MKLTQNYSITKLTKLFSDILLALVLNLLKDIFERSKISFNKFRTSAGNNFLRIGFPEKNNETVNKGCIIKLIFLLLVLILPLSLHAQNSQVISIISPRSQSFSIPRQVAGLDFITHCPLQEKMYSTYALSVEVQSSFRPERINQCLFGQNVVWRDKCDTEWKDFIIVSGSQSEKRTPQKDWLADYFGLPTDFKSMVRFRPRVNNVIIEMQSFFGFNHIKKGLYAELFLPIVYTNWDLNMREAILESGKNGYTPGYFNDSGVERTHLLNSFIQYVSGNSVPTIENLTFHPLRFGKMSPCSRRTAHVAELRTNLGYDHFIKDKHHIGTKIQLAIPFGNRPKSIYLFEPIVGNQHHWELGIGVTAHAFVWENEVEAERVDFFINALINHLFKAHQRRSFDLIGKPNSRYMLAEKMTPLISNNLTGNGIIPLAQFAKEVTSIVNLTTFDVIVRNNVQADVALYCTYTHKNNYWTFGYNAWKRGCEDISIHNKNDFPQNTWAIKGDAQVYGFVGDSTSSISDPKKSLQKSLNMGSYPIFRDTPKWGPRSKIGDLRSPIGMPMTLGLKQNSPTDLPIGTPVALSATQTKATINYGTNISKYGVSSNETERALQIQQALKNPGIDFPQPAFAGNNQQLVASTNDPTSANQINTTIQPILINILDLDCNSAATSGFSHKIFTHYNHITTYGRAEANIGIGSEIEFGRQAGPPPAIGDDKCINCALSFWGVWVKGSISW